MGAVRRKLRLDSLEDRTVPTVLLEVENNDTPAAAQVVAPAVGDVVSLPSDDWLTIVGSIVTNNDLDFYRFTLPGNRGVFFDIDSLETGVSTTLDSVLNLYDANAINILLSDDGYDFEGFDVPIGSVSSDVSFDSSMYADLAAGTYYVSVNSWVNNSVGAYHLRILADPNYTAAPPALHSDSTANDTLFLDFNGHAAAPDAWGTYAAAAYDFNGTPGIYTPAERLAIRHVWEMVTEDFSPFNVDVTTVQSATGDGLGHRHVITNSAPTIVGLNATTQTAAFLNSYASGTNDNVSFTFVGNFSTFGNVNGSIGGISGPINATPVELGNSSSEAFGRALGLGSYRTASNGGSVGTIISNAIMATPDEGLNREVWASGINTNGFTQDDMAVISNATNTFGYRSDDHGNTTSTATPLTATADVYTAIGVIEQVDDIDMFRIAVSGATVIALNVFDYASNLDTVLRLRDASGSQIASSSSTSTSSYDAAISMTLNAGVYYVDVRGTGGTGVAGLYALLVEADQTYVPPVLASIESTALDYTENEILPITQTLTLTDSDSVSMGSATVSITSNFASGEDVLVFTNQAGITGNYNAGVLTLTGVASETAYRTALRSVRYQNLSDAPSTATRTVTFRVVDSAGIISNTQSRDITITTLNDAPALDNTGDMALSSILEDSGAGSGTLITALIASAGGDRITDPDGSVAEGIAITGADTTNGIWQYSIDGGTNWVALGAVTNSNARLLAADANARVRFIPNGDYFGTIATALTFRAWDQSAGTNGGVADTSPNGGATAFSTALETASLTVTGVNDVPGFTKGANQSVNEDAGAQSVPGWATSIVPGPANESGQTVSFIISTNNNALFSALPAISSAGTLTYTPAANANGSATVTVQAKDDGGTANGGQDTSASQSFTITVNAVNDAPVVGASPVSLAAVLEDATNPSGQQVDTFLTSTDVDAGAVKGIAVVGGTSTEGGAWQNSLDGTNWNAFGSPSASAARLLRSTDYVRFIPAANANGTATITYHAWDQTTGTAGSTANLSLGGATGGATAFSTGTQSGNLTITPINDAPSFTKGSDPTVLEDSGTASILGWATNLSKGPANESGQTLSFQITANSNTALFSVAPAVSSTGTLTFTPAVNANGSATITLQLLDNGGTANGGQDTSATQSFTINVTPVNDVPGFTKGGNIRIMQVNPPAQSFPNWATNISTGPADESGQTVSFEVVGNTDPTLFTLGPAIDSAGTLTFTPAADVHGYSTITIRVKDNGGTANGGQDTSATQSFWIGVNPINEAPVFTKGPDQTILEDAATQSIANWATGISAGSSFESDQQLTFEVVSNSNPGLFAIQPSISANGTLTYTSAGNANGSATLEIRLVDDGGTMFGGQDTSATQTFTINVTPVNDRPSFTKGGNQTVLEDSGAQTVSGWATAISPGPADESAQSVSFEVTDNTAPGLFAVAPAIASDGTLTYTPLADAAGTATISVRAVDDGGTANGGLNVGLVQTFTITLTQVNDAPSFVVGVDQSVPEDSGPQTVSDWATAILAGPPNEAGQSLSFEVSTNNDGLFSALPAVSPTGELTFTSALNAYGSALVTLRLKDGGGTANNGQDTSADQSFTIEIRPVNDVPSFVAGSNLVVDEDEGPQLVSGWATALSAGPSNESTQQLTFEVTGNTNPGLFASGPSVAADGTLTYTTAQDAYGVATISVRIADDGGTADGGVDRSASQSFQITVLPVNDPPVATTDNVTAVVGRPLRIAVLANDVDSDGDLIKLVYAGPATYGSVRREGNVVIYTTRLTSGGTGDPDDSFTYTITDSQGGTTTGVVLITVVDNVAPKISSVRLYYGPTAYVDLRSLSRAVIPWASISKVAVQFNENVNVSAANLEIVGLSKTYGTSFSYDSAARIATWTLTEPIGIDRVSFKLLKAGITDISGNALAAGWSRSIGKLVGDVNGDRVVTKTDLAAIKKQFGKRVAIYDIDGSGLVDQADYDLAVANLNGRLR